MQFTVQRGNDLLFQSLGPSSADETQRVFLLQDEGRETVAPARVPTDETQSEQREEKQEGKQVLFIMFVDSKLEFLFACNILYFRSHLVCGKHFHPFSIWSRYDM